MRRFIVSVLLLPLISHFANCQNDNRPKEGPGYYFNKFQEHSNKSVDSALFYVRKLAADTRYTFMLGELLHNSFAQSFQKMWEREAKDSTAKEQYKKGIALSWLILKGMMADTNQHLVNSVRPVYLWAEIQNNSNDDEKLIELTNQFITTHLTTNDLYNNKTGRYALLINQVISKKEKLVGMSNNIFNAVMDNLKKNQLNIKTDTASRYLLEKRAWYRYLYAYTNFIQANKFLTKRDNKKAEGYYKKAFDYSPDLTDNNNSSGYFYDMMFLLEEDKRTFQDDYVNYLTSYSTDKKLTLSMLLTMSLTNPAFKEQLKNFYNSNFSANEKFDEYWIKNINKDAKNAPVVSLKKIDGSTFSSITNKGKWILIDFWGTWCIPCRKEHPDLEKFYKNVVSAQPDKITLLTVACADKEDRVTNYMSQSKYSFPVAMADEKIETTFNIKGYPSKILISPQGKYLLVPFGVDWVEFIKKYADL